MTREGCWVSVSNQKPTSGVSTSLSYFPYSPRLRCCRFATAEMRSASYPTNRCWPDRRAPSAGGAAVLTLAGRNWLVLHVDWPRRIVQVEPTDAPGIARWTGGGQPLGAHVARGVRAVLCGADPFGVEISTRATDRLASARTEQWWATDDATTVVCDDAGRTIWWTFAGWKANLWLAAVAAQAGCRTTVNQVDDLTISLDTTADVTKLRAALAEADLEQLALAPWITSETIDGLKFSECIPRQRAVELVARRLADPAAISIVRSEQINEAVIDRT